MAKKKRTKKDCLKILEAVKFISEERGIDEEVVFSALEDGLAKAYEKEPYNPGISYFKSLLYFNPEFSGFHLDTARVTINKSIIDFGGKFQEVLSSPAFKHLSIKGFSRPYGKKSVKIELSQNPKMNEYIKVEGTTVIYNDIEKTITVVDDKLNIAKEIQESNENIESKQLKDQDENIEPLKVIGETNSGDELLSDQDELIDEENQDEENQDENIESQQLESESDVDISKLSKYVLKFNKGDKLRDQPAGVYDITMSNNVDYILTIDVDNDRVCVNDNEEGIIFKRKLKTMTAVSRTKKSK